ncbi:phosphofructokinase [Bacillus glycinifermentans]|uniref:1-phosphofructokinase n=1 Tax=Bacillus glycinifermentans TaxID=1664069 RepID=UPI000653FA62|nr:1-phosphofructokinase [Bacillus glycinifermentans]KMM60519.1 phosphofructokinase [Bacillus glycinifermentans]MEC0495367.1 1-phosphofructokinase [Bacillus glycinifermentans]MEC0540400.1 1-phosphofructokinase [Bacillus glycinifermentans]MEC3606915.1 1-phosphofructokinase [Bacillus glycinifermentans]UOY88845.1 1-phosphofructokinase [Bacillus glycinifermentans]
MIYTVTLNPSVDYIVHVENFSLGGLNRSAYDSKYPGGKGINVSRVLNRHHVPSKVLGFVGGFTGGYIKSFLEEEKLETAFHEVNGDTRINVKLKTGDETEINGQGPSITDEDFAAFLDQFSDMQEGDIVVLAGSIPASLPQDTYEKIAAKCKEKNVRVVVDISGEALLKAPEMNPLLMKPNHHELGEMFGTTIHTAEEAVPYGKKLIEQGAENAIVSMAGEGALLFTKDRVYHATVPKGKLVNSVGAGDSVVAGFLAGIEKRLGIEEAFRLGVASGSATAFSEELGTEELVHKLLPEVQVKAI